MCRLFGFTANAPTRVECSLVHSINSLVAQSVNDMLGKQHEHGWGVAEYPDGVPVLEKQAWAAYHGEHFKKAAARVYAKVVIAHVRRATVGAPDIKNTHPFTYGHWAFAHNGTVPNFDRVRDILLDEIDPLHRNEIGGSTDSEHIFRYLLSLYAHEPERPLIDILRHGLWRIVQLSQGVDPEAPIGLNIMWSDGQHLVGSRLGRTLWYLKRDGTHICQVCGERHVHHEFEHGYRAVEIASEPITDDDNWQEVPNGTLYAVDPDMNVHFHAFESRKEDTFDVPPDETPDIS